MISNDPKTFKLLAMAWVLLFRQYPKKPSFINLVYYPPWLGKILNLVSEKPTNAFTIEYYVQHTKYDT